MVKARVDITLYTLYVYITIFVEILSRFNDIIVILDQFCQVFFHADRIMEAEMLL